MLKALRRYNKWILVIGGTLLMMAFLVQPAIQQLGGDPGSQVDARLDGRPILARDNALAGRELAVLDHITGNAFSFSLGIDGRDNTHWLLLKAEAEAAGFIGEAEDGPAWLPELAQSLALPRLQQRYRQFWTDPGLAGLFQQFTGKTKDEAYREELAAVTAALEAARTSVASREMTQADVDRALAAARGVFRLIDSYAGAARMSDRLAIAEARRLLDGAYVDILPLAASRFVGDIPTPDDATLQAHVDRFKAVRPGEGDVGVGYLLPPRVKLEWLTLDAAAIEQAIPVDDVDAAKHHMQNRTTYPGEFGAERSRVERDLRAAKLTQIMQEAHRVVQAEVMRVTRPLQPDGRFRRLPADWATTRPKLEAVAQTVVEQVARATGITIPFPSVTLEASRWLTRDELAMEPGIGSATLQLGNRQIPATDVVFSVRELTAPGAEEFPLPVQVGIPLAENYFTDASRNRHYVTIIDARSESPPDTLEEVREKATQDYKELQALERLTQRLPELRSLAVAGGLEAVRDAVFPPPPLDPELVGPPRPDERPAVQTRVIVTRAVMGPSETSTADPAALDSVNAEPVRNAIMDAAAALDPLAPPESFEAEKASVTAAAPTLRSVAVARITALRPMTIDAFRIMWPQLAGEVQRRELVPEGQQPDSPFSLKRLLARHEYILEGSGERLTGEETPQPGA